MLQLPILILRPINQSPSIMLTKEHFSTHKERAKCNKYREAASIIGARFIPLVLETYGQMGQSMQNFLRRTATELFNRSWNYDLETSPDLKSKLVRLWPAWVSSVLQRASARLLMSKISISLPDSQSIHPSTNLAFLEANSWFV